MAIDDRTTNRSYKLPNAGNFLADDVVRLRDALAAIDADVFARYTKLEVDQLISNLIGGAPGALDTLNELADALGDDANFAATVADQLALKANASNVYSKAESDARYVQGSVQTEMVFTATANQSVFTLSTAVINKPSALVTVDGVVQPTSEYSLNMTGTQLTLSEGVPAGTVVRVLALGVSSEGAPADDTVTTVKLRDGAVTTPKLADGAVTKEKIAPGALFPSGTAMLFAQTNAPTGWTKSTTHNNKALRVVSGTAGSGGTTAFTSVFTSRTPTGSVGNTTLTTSQIPSHTHAISVNSSGSGGGENASVPRWNANQTNLYSPPSANTEGAGGGGAHNHSFSADAMDFAVAYVDVIIATKD